MAYNNIPKEKFQLANRGDRISDKKFDTKPMGYFRDAMNRFKKNKSSVAAAIIIVILFLYAIIVPFVSNYSVEFRDGYYRLVLPKCDALAFLGWDGCGNETVSQAGYDYYKSIGEEYGDSAVVRVDNSYVEEGTGKT